MDRRSVAALAALFSACNLDGDVDHQGAYTFLPGSPIPDTAAFPLRELLVVEEDAQSESARFYDFRGDLGSLGVGVESLPRVLTRDGAFSVLFELPASDFVPRAADGGAGGASAGSSDDGGGAGEPAAPELVLERDGATVGLRAIAAGDLAATGASRYTAALSSGEASISAFFGVQQRAEPLAWLRFPEPSAEDPPRYDAKLAPLNLTFARDDDSLLVDPGSIANPDYFVVDLFQRVERLSDQRALEAVIRISIAPAIRYLASPRVLESAFGSLCWSKDEPLFARVTQVARRYSTGARADFAVIQRRADSAEIPTELWSPSVSRVQLRDYCSGFR